MPEKTENSLRYGYSTGACMVALALGLWENFVKKTCPNSVTVLFGDGAKKSLPLITSSIQNGILQIEKDGGDDPDCTHKAILSASFQEANLECAKKEDYIITIGNNKLILQSMYGIGLCTRKGLDCEEGKWAINIKPRQMLIQNLKNANFDSYQAPKNKVFLLKLGVENGEELAKKTLNAKLGIIGGISILGTTGHVRPYSHDAYKETIRICANTIALEKQNHIVFSTGGRSTKTAKNYYDSKNPLPENAYVSIADFIGHSITVAKTYEIQHISVACMAGKLCKYASKQFYTHAHHEEQDITLLKKEISQATKALQQGEILDNVWENANSVREALCSFSKLGQKHILEALATKALAFFKSLYPTAYFHLLVCDFDGELLFIKHSDNTQNIPADSLEKSE